MQRLRRSVVRFASQVDSSALPTLRTLRTELHVLPVSPVQLFRNLYIDLSWYPLENLEGTGRHLQESCGDLNNDDSKKMGTPVEETHNLKVA